MSNFLHISTLRSSFCGTIRLKNHTAVPCVPPSHGCNFWLLYTFVKKRCESHLCAFMGQILQDARIRGWRWWRAIPGFWEHLEPRPFPLSASSSSFSDRYSAKHCRSKSTFYTGVNLKQKNCAIIPQLYPIIPQFQIRRQDFQFSLELYEFGMYRRPMDVISNI